MIDNMQKVNELERELSTQLNLTEREQRLLEALRYLLDRMKEASTWRGVVLVATAIGATLTPAQQDAIVAGGLALAGLVGAFAPDPV